MIDAFPRLAEAEKALTAGRYEDAARIVIVHLRTHPGEPRGLTLLGTAALKMGALVQSEMFFRKALAQGHNDPWIIRNLAASLKQQERLGEALDLFEGFLGASPDDPEVRSTIASILDKLGRSNEALQMLEGLVKSHPNNPNNWISYGNNLRSSGRTDEAIKAYRRAVAIDPERGDAWWGIANIKQTVLTDDDIAAMEHALRTAIDFSNIGPMHFALGQAWHERKRYESAFHHFSEGNRLWAELLAYQPEQLTEEIDQATRLFDRAFFDAPIEGGNPSDAPIFIVSLPRSGSTLLEQMLGNHQDIEALGELTYIPALLRSVMEGATRRGITSVPEAIKLLSPGDRAALGSDYLERAARHRNSDAAHFTDKMPHNWNNTVFIRQILPNARIIDIRRSPFGCCFSNFTHVFSRAHSSSFALEDIGQSYVDYVRWMDHLEGVAPRWIHHVAYEALIEEPKTELLRIADYLGLRWDEAVLSFHESKRTVRTPSAEQVRRPINREGIDSWKPYEQWLGPLREALGNLADG